MYLIYTKNKHGQVKKHGLVSSLEARERIIVTLSERYPERTPGWLQLNLDRSGEHISRGVEHDVVRT